jgi:hypothetical protein
MDKTEQLTILAKKHVDTKSSHKFEQIYQLLKAECDGMT